MDLNNIELPASVVIDLYHSSLVDSKEAAINSSSASKFIRDEITPSPEIITSAPWKSLGTNHKNILVVVHHQEAVHLPDNELNFLSGILGACNLSLADVSIVNIKNHPEATYKELTTFFKSRIVLLFEIEPAAFGLPMKFPYYQIQAFAGNSFLYSPSLKDLENDRVEKSKLWVCLKRMFNL